MNDCFFCTQLHECAVVGFGFGILNRSIDLNAYENNGSVDDVTFFVTLNKFFSVASNQMQYKKTSRDYGELTYRDVAALRM